MVNKSQRVAEYTQWELGSKYRSVTRQKGGLPAWMVSKDPEVGVLRVLEGSLLGQKSNSFHKHSFALDTGRATK